MAVFKNVVCPSCGGKNCFPIAPYFGKTGIIFKINPCMKCGIELSSKDYTKLLKEKRNIMIYKCKENDAVLELGRDKDEILVCAEGETVKTVVGLKDLIQALTLFGVDFPQPPTKSKTVD